MPTYEYICGVCHHKFKRQQSIKATPIRKCPQCGKPKAKRLISGHTFVLRGDGWANTGYQKSRKPPGDSES